MDVRTADLKLPELRTIGNERELSHTLTQREIDNADSDVCRLYLSLYLSLCRSVFENPAPAAVAFRHRIQYIVLPHHPLGPNESCM